MKSLLLAVLLFALLLPRGKVQTAWTPAEPKPIQRDSSRNNGTSELRSPIADENGPVVAIHHRPIPGQYIVTLKPQASPESKSVWHEMGLFLKSNVENKLLHMYELDSGYRGYAGKFSLATLETLKQDENVLAVEQDQWISIDPLGDSYENKGTKVDVADLVLNGANSLFGLVLDMLGMREEQDTKDIPIAPSMTVLEAAPWGCARLSAKGRLASGEDSVAPYIYPSSAGEGAKIYILDTGIELIEHEFEGRACRGPNFSQDADALGDRHGHGTHVAGTAGGKKYGVAKKATMIAIKVLGNDGSGSLSDVVKGLEWVGQTHPPGDLGVVNMSLGGAKSPAVDAAAQSLVRQHISVVTAAGNAFQDACSVSPASAKGVISVAASGADDVFALFSNHGKCTTLIAPGCRIVSVDARAGRSNQALSLSGTSMAAPHVAGLVALVAVAKNMSAPADLYSELLTLAAKDVVRAIPPDTANLLASVFALRRGYARPAALTEQALFFY